MATDPRIKKPEVMPITGLGTPAGIPAPLPMMTANMAPPPVAAPVVAGPRSAGQVLAAGLGTYAQGVRNVGSAIRGIYTDGTNGTTPGLGDPMGSTLPSEIANAGRAVTPPAAVAPAVVAPVAAAPARVTAATPAVSSPAVLAPQGSDATQPVSASEGVLTPAVTDQPGARAGLGGIQDTQEQLARIQANNAAVTRGGLTEINGGFGDRNAAFNDGAALRTAAAQGSWSPRRGYQGNEGAVQAALAPINARARLGEAQLGASTSLANTAAREAGDTARLGMREAGDTARAARTGAIDQQRLDLQRQDFGLRAEGARMDNATKARVEAVQNEIANAKTPEARRAGAEKLAALQGKAQQDQFAAIEVGGGSVPDPTTGLAIAQPKSALIYNRATGQYEQVAGGGGGGAAAARPAIAEGSMSTSNGKPIKYVGGKWVPA